MSARARFQWRLQSAFHSTCSFTTVECGCGGAFDSLRDLELIAELHLQFKHRAQMLDEEWASCRCLDVVILLYREVWVQI